jgi:hypothetical protein
VLPNGWEEIMAEAFSSKRVEIPRLILVPALITLGVTLLRLAGELLHWSKTFFSSDPGGGGAIVGITWLAPVFGIYFALKLSRAGEGPSRAGRAIGLALLGVVLVFAGGFLLRPLQARLSFEGILIYYWLLMALGAALTYPGWPQLFKVLAAYGYAARIPVVIVMFLAFHGNWGTHYDGLPRGVTLDYGFWGKFLWLGFFPQLVLWVAYTILFGAFFGTIIAVIVRRFHRAPQPAG